MSSNESEEIMSQVYIPKKLKDSEISDDEVARRILIMHDFANMECYINTIKTSILRQEEKREIFDAFEMVECYVRKIHDYLVVSKYEEVIKNSPQKAVEGAGEQHTTAIALWKECVFACQHGDVIFQWVNNNLDRINAVIAQQH
jgi:hypothetical protein